MATGGCCIDALVALRQRTYPLIGRMQLDDLVSSTMTTGQALGTLGILAVLAWFLLPVLGRTGATPAERVVGRGPGHVEVELAAGETLVVRGA